MAVIIPDEFAQIIHRFTNLATGKISSVTYGVRHKGAGLLTDIATQADEAWRTSFPASSFDNSARLEPALAYVRVGTDLFLATSALGPLTGATSRTSPPPQVAIVIRKRTTAVGKAQRGRIFLPQWFADETSIAEDGVLTPATVTALQASANNLLTQLDLKEALVGGMWLLHGNTVNDPDLVTSVPVQPIVRTQRRRLPRG